MRLKFLVLLCAAVTEVPAQPAPAMWRVHDTAPEGFLFGSDD